MGFFKSIGNVIGKAAEIATLPVTAPLQVLQSANIPIVSNAAGGVASLTNLPGSILQGQSGAGIIRDSLGNVLPAASALATGGASLGFSSSGLGFDPSMISGLTDIFGNNSGAKQNPLPGGNTFQTAAPATPLPVTGGTPSWIVPAAVVGGVGILAYLYFKGRK
ncbi:MAG: hypothetical protein AB7K68_17570 [Bacteriovoracia bacterium]